MLVEEARQQVEDIKSVMNENIEKVLERGERLDLLEERAESLSFASMMFKRQPVKLVNL